ncbi:hypothetical protein F8M41_019632 [Gigaspora margarita]|uniref:Uncharacterized protein n=1 Tax=Gigaspora margarita TaxID=4874 RepID=A0A8H4EKG9_GIGMA|nr:hypothetical protein F8M41_019632 [Gigaspora margarita]
MAGKYDIIANTSDTLPNMEDSSNIEDDPMDISTKISNLYHLLDLRKDMGPNGFAVDKIIISQNSLKKLCNIIVPNSFKSISEINYASLNSKSLNLTGIYGTRESIAKYLLQSKLIDEQIHSQLVQSQTIKDNNNKPSLKTGIYLLIRNGHGLVIHWPEEDCYNIRASSQKRKNAVTLHRYFTKLTDVHFCLLNEEDLKTFDFNLRKKSSNEDEDDEDEDIDTEYTVKQVQQDRTDFNILKGFELNLPRSKKVINTKLTLPPSFPSAMSIESCHHQSFITCHINEPQEISEYDEHTDTFSGLQYFISEYLNRQDYSLQISSLIEIEDLFNLAYILQVEEELPVSYVAEIEKATDDNKKLEKDEKDIIAVDSDSLTNMYKDRLQFIYGLFDKNLDIPMDDSEQDRIKKEYSDVINKLESSIKDINSPKWKEYKKRFLSIQKSVESSANQEEQPLIYIIYQNLFENKSNYDKLIQNLKDFHKKLLKIPDQEDIPEIPDQQFIQSYLNNKEFDNYPDIKEEIIKLFYNEYTTWRDTFLNSIGDLVKDSQKFQNMSTKLQNNLEIRTHEIGKDYIKKICDNIKKKYNNNGSNRFVVKKVVSKKQKFKLEFELIKKRPSFITFTIYETHIDSEDVQNLFEDPNYVPTPQLQQRISNIGKYYYGQEFYFNSSRYIFK